jgi:hypothetical protein
MTQNTQRFYPRVYTDKMGEAWPDEFGKATSLFRESNRLPEPNQNIFSLDFLTFQAGSGLEDTIIGSIQGVWFGNTLIEKREEDETSYAKIIIKTDLPDFEGNFASVLPNPKEIEVESPGLNTSYHIQAYLITPGDTYKGETRGYSTWLSFCPKFWDIEAQESGVFEEDNSIRFHYEPKEDYDGEIGELDIIVQRTPNELMEQEKGFDFLIVARLAQYPTIIQTVPSLSSNHVIYEIYDENQIRQKDFIHIPDEVVLYSVGLKYTPPST